MSKVTRRQVIRGGVVVGAALIAGKATGAPENQQQTSFVDWFLPEQMTTAEIEASQAIKFTKLEFAGSKFFVGLGDFLGGGVPHAWIALYAPKLDGNFHRCLVTESWTAGKIEATIDHASGMLELREAANSKLKGQVVLACNLRTIGTQHSVIEK